MTGHKHAKHMADYAADAAETDRPWDRWQMRYHGGDWSALTCSPSWTVTAEFRRKPTPMEQWVNVDLGGERSFWRTEAEAKAAADRRTYARVAVHMREVLP